MEQFQRSSIDTRPFRTTLGSVLFGSSINGVYIINESERVDLNGNSRPGNLRVAYSVLFTIFKINKYAACKTAESFSLSVSGLTIGLS